MHLEIEIECSNVEVHNYLIYKKTVTQSGKFSLTSVIPVKKYEFNLIICPHCKEIIPLKRYSFEQVEIEAEEARPLHEKRIQERKDLGKKILKIGGSIILFANVINIIASLNMILEILGISFIIILFGLGIYFDYQNFEGQYSNVAKFYLDRGVYSLVESWPDKILSKETNKFITGRDHRVKYNTKILKVYKNTKIGDFGSNISSHVEQDKALNKYYKKFLTDGKEILGNENDIKKWKSHANQDIES
jgi:hypothetical protein